MSLKVGSFSVLQRLYTDRIQIDMWTEYLAHATDPMPLVKNI